MFRNLTFNSIIWILMGLICLGAGAYFGWDSRRNITRQFPLPGGLVFTGIAMILCGLTNGFTDQTPLGRKFRKLGAMLFIGGLPLLFYGAWRFI